MNISVTWGTAGFGALITLFFTLVYTGKLTPKSIVDRIIESYEGRLADKSEQIRLLTLANEQLIQANKVLLDQQHQSLEIGRTTSSVIQSLPSVAAPAGGGPGVPEVA